MPISAKFIADFTAFDRAVEQADTSLRHIGVTAEKVGKQINKMADEFRGDKIVREAVMLEKAVREVGGASKLTAAEQEKVNKTVQDAIDKYKALGLIAPDSLKRLAEETKKVGAANDFASKTIAGFGDHFKGVLTGMVSATAIIGGAKAAFSTLTEFIGGSIESYAAAEAAQKKLSTALQAAGQATPQVIGQFNKLSSEFQKTTTFSDDLITEMQGLLVQVGGVMPREMEGALKAATDLSEGLGVDLRTATLAVAKAFEGNTGALKKFGVDIDEARLKAEGMPAVLDAINERFGGQAQAAAETYAGKIKQMANAWDDLKEAVGKAIVTDDLLQAGLHQAAEAIKGTGDAAGQAEPKIIQFFLAFVPNKLLQDYIQGLTGVAIAIDQIGTAASKVKPLPIPTVRQEAPEKALPINQEEILRAAGMHPDQIKARDEAKKANEAYAKSVRELGKSFSDAKLAAEVKKLDDALRSLSAGGKPTATELERVGKAALELWKNGATLTPQLFQILVATQQVTPGLEDMAGGLQKVGTELKIVTTSAIPFIGLLNDLGSLPASATIPIPKIEDLVPIQRTFADLMTDIQDLGQMLSRIPGLFGEIAGAASEAAGAIRSFATGDWFGGLLQAGNLAIGIIGRIAEATRDGRHAVEDFAASFDTFRPGSGFDELHAQLNALPSGEEWWTRLTQGVRAGDLEGAQQIIAEIRHELEFTPEGFGFKTQQELQEIAEKTRDVWAYMVESGQYTAAQIAEAFSRMQTAAAEAGDPAAQMAAQAEKAGFKTKAQLEQVANEAVRLWEYMRDSGEYSAEQVEQAWKRAQDALVESGNEAAKQLAKLNEEIEGLNKSIEAEAPEEVMGVIESQARDRLAQLVAERQRVQAEMDAAAQATQDSADETGESVDGIGTKLEKNARDWEAWRGRVQTAIGDVNAAARGVAPPSPPGGGSGAAGATSGRAELGAGGAGSRWEDFVPPAEKVQAAVRDVAEDARATYDAVWAPPVTGPIWNAEEKRAELEALIAEWRRLYEEGMAQATPVIPPPTLEDPDWAGFVQKAAQAGDQIAADLQGTVSDLGGSWTDYYEATADAADELEKRLGLEAGSIKTLNGRMLSDMTRQWEQAGNVIVSDFRGTAEDIERLIKGIDVTPIEIPIEFGDPGPMPVPDLPEFQHGTRGQFLNFGEGTLVRLHGRERVQTEAEARQATAEPLAPIPRGGDVIFQPGAIVVNGTADRQFAQRLANEILLGGETLTIWQRIRGR